jgi:N-acyl-phosphatidylethanolamine-hydrolysing phospholipase D
MARITQIFILTSAFFLLSGCSGASFLPKFLSRTAEHFSEPTQTVANKITRPVHSDTGFSVLWIGHASMLIQMDDKVFLTDPVFTHSVGMVSSRVVEPGIDAQNLMRVDYMLISHTHFDHFSYGSLDQLPKGGTLILPLGGLDYLPEFGFRDTRELKPWNTVNEGGVKITAVPVKHFSGRYGFDIAWMSDRGYTGYVIEYKGKTLFVSGDTGYDSLIFKEIGRRFSIDVALLPIAPIEPRDFMKRVHTDPAEALQIFEDLKAKLMIPMHHRTFYQGLEPRITYAEELLQKIIAEGGLQEKVYVIKIGEQKNLR